MQFLQPFQPLDVVYNRDLLTIYVAFYSWDQQYQTELENFLDHGDIGEIWFGKRVMDTIVTYIDGKIDRESASILDLGSGNGVLLIHLVFNSFRHPFSELMFLLFPPKARKGFRRLTGVDYVPSAIKLARTIATARQVDINYEVMNNLYFHQNLQKTSLKNT